MKEIDLKISAKNKNNFTKKKCKIKAELYKKIKIKKLKIEKIVSTVKFLETLYIK